VARFRRRRPRAGAGRLGRTREREYGSLEHGRDFLERASPLSRVDRIRAPLFVIHGANDPGVPLSETEQLVDAMRARGVTCELLV
jgi:dipeptidyl aminopeptidase/acylaminoacyl peptidase